MTTTLPPTVPSVLLPELLGFVPQFLLDDIIDTANDEVRQAVEAMEVCLQQWVTKRISRVGDDWDSSQDIEQGLVAFQTLLYSHVDIAFDFFEAWSLRNIFAIPADLPIIAPHQRDLDLDQPPDEEAVLLAEIDELRRKIKVVRFPTVIFVRVPLISRFSNGKYKDSLPSLSVNPLYNALDLGIVSNVSHSYNLPSFEPSNSFPTTS